MNNEKDLERLKKQKAKLEKKCAKFEKKLNIFDFFTRLDDGQPLHCNGSFIGVGLILLSIVVGFFSASISVLMLALGVLLWGFATFMCFDFFKIGDRLKNKIKKSEKQLEEIEIRIKNLEVGTEQGFELKYLRNLDIQHKATTINLNNKKENNNDLFNRRDI